MELRLGVDQCSVNSQARVVLFQSKDAYGNVMNHAEIMHGLRALPKLLPLRYRRV